LSDALRSSPLVDRQRVNGPGTDLARVMQVSDLLGNPRVLSILQIIKHL
jgi:hypothetical protein